MLDLKRCKNAIRRERFGLREIFTPTTIYVANVSRLAGHGMSSQGKNKELNTDLLDTHSIADRLNSWKAIARHLRREVRTVQLWEKHEGLPVHRHFHNRQGTVFAFRGEINLWCEQRAAARVSAQATKPEPDDVPKTRHRLAVLNGTLADIGPGGLLADIVGLLDPTKVELLHDTAAASAEFLLRLKAVATSDCATLELFSVRLQTVIWCHTFAPDRPADVRKVSRLVQEIQESLWLQSVSTIKFISRPSRAPKPGAREAYVKGRYLWSRRTEEDLRKAVNCFRTAIWRDPDFALAYTGVADSLTLLSFYEIVSPAEAMPRARAAALRA
jgi:hypothetical protein